MVEQKLDQVIQNNSKRVAIIQSNVQDQFRDCKSLIENFQEKLRLLTPKAAHDSSMDTVNQRMHKFEEEMDEYKKFVRDLNIRSIDGMSKLTKRVEIFE